MLLLHFLDSTLRLPDPIMSAFSFTAPQFTEQDSTIEWNSLTPEEKRRIENACFGQDDSSSPSVEETPELVETSLRDMARCLSAIEDKDAYNEALQVVPHLVQQESAPIRFLRCERFCPDKAATRLVKYWEMRKAFFEHRAFLPMSLEGSLLDDMETLNAIPDLYFVTGKDEHGRYILFSNKARADFSRYTRLSVLRVMWYHMHVISEDVDVQRRGIIGVGHFRTNSPKQFDRVQSKLFFTCIREALPVKFVCAHICHAPSFFTMIIFPVIRFLMGKDIRLHTRLHNGSEETVLLELEKYGIQRHNIFKCMGGTFDMHHVDAWLEERRRLEAPLLQSVAGDAMDTD
jgi:hypothetical protein